MSNSHVDMGNLEVQSRRERVVALTQQNYTALQIAQILGITTRSVVRHRKAAGIAQTPPSYLTEAEIQQATAMLEDGASRREVARTLGRSESAIGNHFPNYGWNQSQACTYGRMRRMLDQLEGIA